ncbi:Protein T09A5.15 [Aphelenchoides avenae]|nr:Protein T09A5.15 [Aphelenchus avenae]
MRPVPKGAPATGWLWVRSRFPVLDQLKVRRPEPGTVAVIGTVSLIAVAFFAVGIYPKIYHEDFEKKQKEVRSRMRLNQSQLAGHMPVWSDPFDREKAKPAASS